MRICYLIRGLYILIKFLIILIFFESVYNFWEKWLYIFGKKFDVKLIYIFCFCEFWIFKVNIINDNEKLR